MADQVLKDSKGHKIGTILTASNGKQPIKDSKGHKKGTYDPKTNKTKDERGHSVGTGNLLTTLLQTKPNNGKSWDVILVLRSKLSMETFINYQMDQGVDQGT